MQKAGLLSSWHTAVQAFLCICCSYPGVFPEPLEKRNISFILAEQTAEQRGKVVAVQDAIRNAVHEMNAIATQERDAWINVHFWADLVPCGDDRGWFKKPDQCLPSLLLHCPNE